ncbi:Uncharacterized protein OBRU01_02281, partial [Operophtera brumata]
MTSTNDGKEVKSYQTSGPKGKSYFIELYKVTSERTKHLCDAWRRVHSLCQHSAPTTHSHLVSWLQRHTARTVLQNEWRSPARKDDRASLEEAINVFIVESRTAAATRADGCSPPWEVQLVARGEWFKRILDHPWKHPVLNCLLNPDGTPPTDDEVLEWLKEERGVTFVMRLQTLVAEKQCDDIAVMLATAVMGRIALTNFEKRLKEEAGFTVDVLEMLTDIEFVVIARCMVVPQCAGGARSALYCCARSLARLLGAVLACSDRVKCECALTAFSVHPSPQMYERIKAAPALPSIHL